MADARVTNVRYYPIKNYETSSAQLLLWPINETDRFSILVPKNNPIYSVLLCIKGHETSQKEEGPSGLSLPVSTAFLRLGLPSTLIRHAFRKRSSKPEEFENVGFSFLCGRKTFWKRSFSKAIVWFLWPSMFQSQIQNDR